MVGVSRRHVTGMSGGVQVKRDFLFAPLDGEKYPSESTLIQTARLPKDPLQQQTWLWAMSKCATEGCWLVVPLDPNNLRLDASRVRSAVWRTLKSRRGVDLTSEVVGTDIYITVVK